MDVSSVQAKSSDFSIERILSDKRRTSEAPSWVCCTRYQPPRIPRAASTGSRVRRSGRHARVPFTAAQAQALEAAYARAPYLAPPALKALAAALQLRDDRIKIWFQNRRARERREKSATIVPPHSIPLPPTPNHPGFIQKIPWPQNPFTNRFETHTNATDYSVSEPKDLSNSSLNHVLNSDASEDDSSSGRPETPLDVESVDD